MKNLHISQAVIDKLTDRHKVSRREVEQCFANKCGLFLEDTREDHRSDPATLWFIAPTNVGRQLKVVFIFKEGLVHLRTAYEPNPDEIEIYDRRGR